VSTAELLGIVLIGVAAVAPLGGLAWSDWCAGRQAASLNQ
jgi:hypothetical protein